jgi:LAO/AO transport system kinase
MKAGIIEIADILIVNKADHPGADVLVSQLTALLSLAPAGTRRPPILKTIAMKGEGLEKLADAIADHRKYLEESGELLKHRLANARHQVLATARQILLDAIRKATPEAQLEDLVRRVADRTVDPHTAAEELAAQVRR